MSKKKIACIILAAGKSERFGKNKLFVLLDKKPLLFMVIDSILSFKIVERIVVVTSEDNFDRLEKKYAKNQEISVVSGGKNRVESTIHGLRAIEQEHYEYTYVHDGARPIFSKGDFLSVKKEILSKNLDGVVQYVKVYDSLMSLETNMKNNHYLDKSKIVQLKTPHIYKVHSILESLIDHKSCDREQENIEILSSCGKKVGFVQGSVDNIKITYGNDMRVIKKLL